MAALRSQHCRGYKEGIAMLTSHAMFTSALPIVTLPVRHFLQVFAGGEETQKTHTKKNL